MRERSAPSANDGDARLNALGVPLALEPMEARLTTELPQDDGWQFEPKWDGFRCLAFRAGDEVAIKAKSGKSLSRFFPEVVSNLRALPVRSCVLDGELVIPLAETLSFGALQARLHPAASRIDRLSTETPATLIVFDCLLKKARQPLLTRPFEERRAALETGFTGLGGVALTPFTRKLSEAEAWLRGRRVPVDGVMAKRLDLDYRPGERAMVKVKRLRTADCVVGGFRYETDGRLVGSLLLGLYDEGGLLHHVGFTSGLSQREKPDLTRRLETLVAAPGFTGNAPGGPSRWSTSRSAEWRPASRPSWSWRSDTTTSPTIGSVMEPSWCGGGRTKRQGSAPSTSFQRRNPGLRCHERPASGLSCDLPRGAARKTR